MILTCPSCQLHYCIDPAASKVLAMSSVERCEETASEVWFIGVVGFVSHFFKPREAQKRVRDLLAL